jgi:RNA polymerase sigma-70 factor (ECF subfamily)
MSELALALEQLPWKAMEPPIPWDREGLPASDGPAPDSTFDLVLLAQRGDDWALEQLCARYLPRMRRWAHGRLPGWARGLADTQDLVQDTLVQVARRIRQFEPRHEGAFQAYVRQALLNRIRDEVRRARGPVADPIADSHPSPDASPLEEAIGSELLERYEKALQRVKPEDREAIVARVELGLAWREVAGALGKNSNESAQMTVRRALVRLAREMSYERA